jgi:hypothetical protein
MTSRASLACVALALAACAPEPDVVRGIQVRVGMDRAEARIGDAIGITIEIDAPTGYSIGRPDPPARADVFLTESIERPESVDLVGGRRHRLLWTLRAKQVGEQTLPSLRIPLVHPEGRIEPLPVGGMPFEVRSMRAELPEREVFFDLRDPPPPEASRRNQIVGSVIALVLASIAAAAWWRHRHGVLGAPPEPQVLAGNALARLDASAGLGEPRLRAGEISATLLDFAAARWELPAASRTPADLDPPVPDELIGLLRRVDGERFAREPESGTIDEVRGDACTWLRDVVQR